MTTNHRRRLRRRTLLIAAVGLSPMADAHAEGTDCPEADPAAATPAAPDETCVPTRPADRSLVPDLAALKSPESPAFAALDLAPTSITRPGTPTGAALTLATGIAHGVLTPGQNVAVEFAPFWLVPHPRLSAGDLESEWWRFDRRLSVSLASTSGKVKLPDAAGTLADTDVGRVAFGLRTTLLRGDLSNEALACGRLLDELTERDVAAVARAKKAFIEQWKVDHPRPKAKQLPDVDRSQYKNREEYDKLIAARNKAMDALNADMKAEIARWSRDLDAAMAAWREKLHRAPGPEVLACMDVIHHRKGVMVDVAAVEVLNFPGNDITRLSDGGSRNMIAWLTGGYTWSWGPNRPGGGHAWDLSALGLVKRDQEHVAHAAGATRTQVGARGVLAFERWGVSAEGLLTRTTAGKDTEKTYRVSATVDYHLKSGMWLTLTGGADLDENGKPDHPIGLVNFHASFGPERLMAPDTTVSRPTGSTP